MGHGTWEPDSVPIKSGPPRSNWNSHGDPKTDVGIKTIGLQITMDAKIMEMFMA